MEKLALHGGPPVRRSMLPYGRHLVEDEDARAVVNILRSSWLTTGPAVGEFEAAFAAAAGSNAAVAFSSGTAALHGAMFAAGIKSGDEVITTPLTFCASANCVLYQGGRPVFADVETDTLNLDSASVRERISSRTRAIIAVHFGGHPVELTPLVALANEFGLMLVQDACHALGATYHGAALGSFGDMTVCSFHPVKHVTTAEGGMVATNDPDVARRLRMFRNHGITTEARDRMETGQWFYEMEELGYNYRLSDVMSALGSSQLRRLSANLARRRDIAHRYATELAGVQGLKLPVVRADVEPAWHLYPIRVAEEQLKTTRSEIFAALRAEGLGVNVHYIPVYFHPYYRRMFGDLRGLCPNAERAYEQLISLPMYHGMTATDIDDVITATKKVFTHFAR